MARRKSTNKQLTSTPLLNLLLLLFCYSNVSSMQLLNPPVKQPVVQEAEKQSQKKSVTPKLEKKPTKEQVKTKPNKQVSKPRVDFNTQIAKLESLVKQQNKNISVLQNRIVNLEKNLKNNLNSNAKLSAKHDLLKNNNVRGALSHAKYQISFDVKGSINYLNNAINLLSKIDDIAIITEIEKTIQQINQTQNNLKESIKSRVLRLSLLSSDLKVADKGNQTEKHGNEKQDRNDESKWYEKLVVVKKAEIKPKEKAPQAKIYMGYTLLVHYDLLNLALDTSNQKAWENEIAKIIALVNKEFSGGVKPIINELNALKKLNVSPKPVLIDELIKTIDTMILQNHSKG